MKGRRVAFERSVRGPLIGYAVAVANEQYSLDFLGSPHEVLVEFRNRELSFERVASERTTRIVYREVFKTSPKLEIRGGPRADVILELLDVIDVAGLDRARRLLRRNPTVLKEDATNGAVVLLSAVWSGHLEGVRLLLDHGVDTNFASHLGMTALHWAAALNEGGIVASLLDANTVADPLSWMLVTPFELARLNECHAAENEMQTRFTARFDSSPFSVKQVLDRMRDPSVQQLSESWMGARRAPGGAWGKGMR